MWNDKRHPKEALGEKKWKQLDFNKRFLESIKEEFGELHCEFCGKHDLVIYDWFDASKRKDIMATADHFIPKSLDKENLAFNRQNMVVACDHCNNKKGNKIYSPDTLEHKYEWDDEKERLELYSSYIDRSTGSVVEKKS